jgi:hypothetical protein
MQRMENPPDHRFLILQPLAGTLLLRCTLLCVASGKELAMATRKRASAERAKATRRKASAPGRKPKRWSAEVLAKSNALDLTPTVFTWKDPRRIARSLKRSAELSHRRKGGPFQSAMSMLNFYINRAGRNLPATRLKILNRAKTELRRLFHREPE